MRLSLEDHNCYDWRIAEIAPDFDLLDAWALPVEGDATEFADLCDLFLKMDQGGDGGKSLGSRLSRGLFRLRAAMGQWFGWDDETNTLPIPGCTETSLRERLPGDLANTLGEADHTASAFAPIFRTDRESAMELSNSTVHAIMQLGWVPVPNESGRFKAQMGVYVKTRGRFGPFYMAAIAPFRHGIVYPAMMKRIGKLWSQRSRA